MTAAAHELYRELVAGHALSALEPEDEQTLVRHLSACDLCSRELVAAQDLLAQLSYAAPQVEPPAGLFDRIREQVLLASPDAFDVPTPVGAVVPIERARSRRLQTRAAKIVAVAAVTATAAVISLGAWNVSLQRDNAEQVQASAAVEVALDVLGNQPGRTVPMNGADGSVAAVAVMHFGRMDLVTDGLAPNDRATSTYVLWGQEDEDSAPYALAAFDITSGNVDVVRDVPAPVGPPPPRLLITEEAGRTPPASPTEPVVAEGLT